VFPAETCATDTDICVSGLKTSVIGVPKTIDGDLKNDAVAVSFGFDTACKVRNLNPMGYLGYGECVFLLAGFLYKHYNLSINS
jgi:hypothetical protein